MYGLSKYLGELKYEHTLTVRTSIIGPELNGNASFLCWFLSNEDGSTVNGYSNHMWNGITTYYWAKFSINLIENWSEYNKRTILASNCLSKYDMCEIFNKVYQRNIIVKPFETEQSLDKCLEYDVKLHDIEHQLIEMLKFMS